MKQAKSQQGEFAEPKSRAGRRGIDIGPLSTRFLKPADAVDGDLIWPGEDYFVLQDRMRPAGREKLGIEFKGFGFHTLRRTYASFRYLIGATTAPDAGLVREHGPRQRRNDIALHTARSRWDRGAPAKSGVLLSGDSRDGRNVN